MSYFYYNYFTLSKTTLLYFDLFYTKHFLIFYLFLKMGGLIGYKLQYYFYRLLSADDLITYTITNFYLYFYLFNIEQLICYNNFNTYFIISIVFLNFLIILFNKNKIKTKRDFLFFSSQMLLNNIFILLFI